MTKVDVWMPIYIGDYLASTSRLTTEQHGAYLLLIMDYWKNGPPPDDDAVLAQICRMSPDAWSRSRSLIVSFFSSVDGKLTHSRIEMERSRAVGNTTARSISGSLGAASKWGTSGDENRLKRSERLAFARRLGTHSSGEWEALKQVCGDSCLRCGDVSQLVKDHITPIYQGGSDAISNIQPLCRSCNSSKGADCTDHRPSDWQESLAKRLANACQTPGPSPSPMSTPTDVGVGDVDQKKVAKKAAQMPADFYPDDTGVRYAETRRVGLAVELESFRNWHTAKGSLMKDWQAAWRTWCDKAVEFGRAGAGQPASRKTPVPENFANRDYGQGGRL